MSTIPPDNLDLSLRSRRNWIPTSFFVANPFSLVGEMKICSRNAPRNPGIGAALGAFAASNKLPATLCVLVCAATRALHNPVNPSTSHRLCDANARVSIPSDPRARDGAANDE
jgi:hypothetical protein